MSLVDDLAGAIGTFEGAFKTGSVAQRNNNPGNLRTWGNLPRRDGYAVFPSMEAGWAALRRQVELNISRGLTLFEFFAGKPDIYAGYAPAADQNQPATYAAFVGQRVGLPLDVPLNQASVGTSVEWPSGSGPAEPGAGDMWLVAGLAVAGLSLAVLAFG